MKKLISVVLLSIAVAIPAIAQQAGQGTKGAPQKTGSSKPEATAPAPTPQGLSIDGVIAMAQAGLSEDVIIARLRKEDKAFDLSTDDMIRLKKANISDAVMKVMLDPKAEIKPAQTFVQVPVIPGGIAKPSGATPSNDAVVPGDPNDPTVAHDSGIYLYTKNREGKPEMIVLERAAYHGTKTGGIFGSAMTYGIMKAKSKAVVSGAHAGSRTSDGNPVFYFYFDDKAAGLGKSYFGGSSLSSPNQFVMLKLDVGKSSRDTIVGEFGAFGASTGAREKSMVGFKSERIRPGLYKVTPDGTMEPGEYCFFANVEHDADMFDFGVNPAQ